VGHSTTPAPDPGGVLRGEAPPFGQSLQADLYGVSKDLCDDLSFGDTLLDGLTDYLGMHKQSPRSAFARPTPSSPTRPGSPAGCG
jgi:hypothetical protein